MEYAKESEFIKDYISRTKMNYDVVKRQNGYEVTQLINSMVGFLILPKEREFENIVDKMIDEKLLGDLKKGIEIDTYTKKADSLKVIIRHMKNAVSHYKLEFKAEKPNMNSQPLNIKTISFFDANPNNSSEQFKMTVNVDFLEKFLLEFSGAVSNL